MALFLGPLYLILQLLTVSPSSVFPLDNGNCVFSAENKQLECSNLFDFPNGTDSIEVLRARNNTFIKISTRVLVEKRLTSLKAIVIRRSGIEIIQDEAFTGLDNLILLDLGKNKIGEIGINVFKRDSKLQVLVLSENRIKSLSERFGVVPNLILLDLSYNRIERFEENLLQSFWKIEFLDLSSNPLEISQRSTQFLRSVSLKVLRIADCNIRSFPKNFFDSLPGLLVLDLSGNDLKTWPAEIPNLRTLHANANLIKHDDFLPSSLETILESEMEIKSKTVVAQFLNNLQEIAEGTKELNFLKYPEFLNKTELKHRRINWESFTKKCLLFVLLVYLSLIYTLLFSQVFKSLASKPYHKVIVEDDI